MIFAAQRLTSKIDRFEFDTLEAFLTEATSPPHPSADNVRKSSIDSAFSASFGQFASFEQTEELARRGWADGLDRLTKTAALIEQPEAVTALVPSPTWAEEGDEVSIDRFLDNESDCFIQFPAAIVPACGRVVSVILHSGGMGHISASAFVNRGAAALSLIDALERAGFRAEVTIASTSTTKDRAFQFSCIIKRAEDPLDLDRMAFFLMSASVQRRFLFRLRERTEHALHWLDYSMGRTQDIPAELIPEGAIYFPAPSERLSQEDAAAQANALLAQFLATA